MDGLGIGIYEGAFKTVTFFRKLCIPGKIFDRKATTQMVSDRITNSIVT